MEHLTLESGLGFLAAATCLAALVYAGQLRRRLSFLLLIVVLFMLQNLMWGLIYLDSGPRDLWDAPLRLVMFSVRCFWMVALVCYVISRVDLRWGKGLAWLYAAAGCGLWAATLAGYGEVEASAAGTMPISEGLKGARRAFVAARLVLAAVAMLAGLKASKLPLRQRSRTALRASLPVGMLYALHLALSLSQTGTVSVALLLAVTQLAVSAVLCVLILEEAALLAPLSIKVQVLWRILIHRGTLDAAALNDCLEQAMILSALRRSENNKAEAARLLGLSKSTFHRKASRFLQQSESETSLT